MHACGSLRGQFNLHMAAHDRPDKLPELESIFRDMFNEEVSVDTSLLRDVVDSSVENKVHGALIVNPSSGETEFEINTIN